jgi:hypothetical protein
MKPPTNISGFRFVKVGQQMAVQCINCHRSWNADRVDVQANREYLEQHAAEHRSHVPTGTEEDPY